MKLPRNKSAFPITAHPDGGIDDFGMTLRDYFAAKAMQALMLKSRTIKSEATGFPPDLSADAYDYADAMLKAREQ